MPGLLNVLFQRLRLTVVQTFGERDVGLRQRIGQADRVPHKDRLARPAGNQSGGSETTEFGVDDGRIDLQDIVADNRRKTHLLTARHRIDHRSLDHADPEARQQPGPLPVGRQAMDFGLSLPPAGKECRGTRQSLTKDAARPARSRPASRRFAAGSPCAVTCRTNWAAGSRHCNRTAVRRRPGFRPAGSPAGTRSNRPGHSETAIAWSSCAGPIVCRAVESAFVLHACCLGVDQRIEFRL